MEALMIAYSVKKRKGHQEGFNSNKILACIKRACDGLTDVNPDEVFEEVVIQLYDGITTTEIDQASVLAARSRIEIEPNYSFVAARLLLNILYKEAIGKSINVKDFESLYRKCFIDNIASLIKEGKVDQRFLEIDLNLLASKLCPDRDFLFKYPGIQTLYDRYFLRLGKKRCETPQGFLMRVAIGLSLKEKNREEWAVRIYDKISEMDFFFSTPINFNSGTTHSQMASCFLSTFEDSIDGIFGSAIHSQARLSKYAGGLGVDFCNTRATGAKIKKLGGTSSGLIPWLKVFNDTVLATNQAGKRKGAADAWIEPWHADVEEFLDIRRNTGDDRRRCRDIHIALWMPDLFLEKVKNDEVWYLFSPDEVNLHHIYGEQFNKAYEEYVKLGKEGKLNIFKSIRAKDLWRKILSTLHETGEPYLAFKDTNNKRYANKHVGVIYSQNLCTETSLHSKPTEYNYDGTVAKYGETAVCTLAAVNLPRHLKNGLLDREKLKDTIEVITRALDNSIDLSFYPIKEAELSHLANRPIGISTMGVHDFLHECEVPYDSEEAISLCESVQEYTSYFCIEASSDLAKERGSYRNYEGSDWQKGILPVEEGLSLDWGRLRDIVQNQGMRNSQVTCQQPTATISTICGCSAGIDPDFSVLHTYSTLSGELPFINHYFVNRMKKLGLWSKGVVQQLKKHNGDLSELNIPQQLKDEFKTAFDIDQKRLIRAAAARQKYIDMSQSLNLYYQGDSLKELSEFYFLGHGLGVKSFYYLRTKSASSVEKSTGEGLTCTLDNGSCESCQ